MPAPQFTEVLNQQHAFLWIAVCLFAVAGLVVYIYVRGSRAAAEDAAATLPEGVRLVGVENTDAMFPSHASAFTPPKAPPPLPRSTSRDWMSRPVRWSKRWLTQRAVLRTPQRAVKQPRTTPRSLHRRAFALPIAHRALARRTGPLVVPERHIRTLPCLFLQ
jgi:uncharacterized protein YjeT (DUF2065 family)